MNEFLTTVIEGFTTGLVCWLGAWKLMFIWKCMNAPLDPSHLRND